ncbi:MAG: FimB/Mfa2 family fimbrial subunit [Alistipes sp.]|nr:FimB/Mfa2 family fimbrial subunit [Alistipes sp.]
MNITAQIAKFKTFAAAMALVLSATSCDGVIYDGEGDCSVKYRIEFEYERNMEFADAFASKVGSVALYVFDASGVLVHQAAESGAALAADDYAMTLEMEPGEYDLLAWCGVDGSSFSVPEATVGKTTLEQMQCTMARKSDDTGAYVDSDLDALFHGLKRINYTSEPGVHTEVISLTKNTNNFRIILQQTWSDSSLVSDVEIENFEFTIVDDNGKMDYDNSVILEQTINYRPWDITTGYVDVDADVSSTRASQVAVSVAELTTARLMTDHNPVLIVNNKVTGERVLSVPIVDYALLVKGNYNRQMDDQEYLDRQDEYNMTFFLHNGQWLSSSIVINSWRVVLTNENL